MLEFLKDLKEIDGLQINRDYEKTRMLENWHKKPIYIDDTGNIISMILQVHPESHGCKLETILKIASKILDGSNELMPCAENKAALFHIDTALQCLEEKEKRRENQRLIQEQKNAIAKERKIVE